MLNREIYSIDPSTRKLMNDGVSNVNDDPSFEKQAVLRYELDTFVCEGQYQIGMERIIESYLSNLNHSTQPSVWVSGFFGSGKSHLVKMLRALWVDTSFSDGASARGIAILPQRIKDLLVELSMQSKKYGGLHAAAGTLGAAARGSVRLSLLHIIFKSVGLPGKYHLAKFVLWLKKEKLYDIIKERLKASDQDFEYELDRLYVSEELHKALVDIKPNLYPTREMCSNSLSSAFPEVNDISNEDMHKIITESLSVEGKFPLTLVVMDEVQQYIGESSEKSILVQEMVEDCSKSFKGKLLFVATGQTAITGTSFLKKLEGRFTVRVELSDADVDSVIRKVILSKKPEAKAHLEELLNKHQGEISRHLGNTAISHKIDDNVKFYMDYPILPVRRKFWEIALRNLDVTGTDSQLRNQLSMIHKAVKTNLDKPIGNLIPTEYLYFEAADKMLQSNNLPRRVFEKSVILSKGSEDDQILASAIAIIFLIGKINHNPTHAKELGIRATQDTIVDLMLRDLQSNSSALRSKLPSLLEAEGEVIMKVGDEYRIQTEESTAWSDEFNNQRSVLANEIHRIDDERNDRLKRKFNEAVKLSGFVQGDSKESREIAIQFEGNLSSESHTKLLVWVRNGWVSDETSVVVDARKMGNESPIVTVFVPKRNADEIRKQVMDFKAAQSTLDKRGNPDSAEGKEARSAMDTTKSNAEARLDEFLRDCLSGAKVFQAGGNEVLEHSSLVENIKFALEKSLLRLFPEFDKGDNPRWTEVYNLAIKGSVEALKKLPFDGDVQNQEVCKKILAFIGGGKKGEEIRSHFKQSPFGWTQDSIDGALLVLRNALLIRMSKSDHKHEEQDLSTLERKQISKLYFKSENNPPTAEQRLQIRALFMQVQVTTKSNEEASKISEFIEKCKVLHQQSGGEAPKPERIPFSPFKEIESGSENEKLHIIFNNRDEFKAKIIEWRDIGQKILNRESDWTKLFLLREYTESLEGVEMIHSGMNSILEERNLLLEPNPLPQYIQSLTDVLREELNTIESNFNKNWKEGENRLEGDSYWEQLDTDTRRALRVPHGLTESGKIKFELSSTESILSILQQTNLSSLKDKVQAMPSRYSNILLEAAKLLEPKTQQAVLPQATLKTDGDVDVYVEKVSKVLKEQIKKGPVVI